MSIKKLFIALIILITLIPVFAIDTEIKWSNDLYRFGIGPNYDDGMTGGVTLSVTDINNFDIEFTGNSYTNRGYNSANSTLVQSRIDKMTLVGGYDYSFISGNTLFDFRTYVGVDVFGNLGLSKIQDLIHENMTYSYHLNIPYPEGIRVSPTFGVEMSTTSKIGTIKDSDLNLITHVEGNPGLFTTSVSAEAGFALEDMIDFTFGIQSTSRGCNNATIMVYSKMATGMYYSFNFNTEVFGVGYKLYSSIHSQEYNKDKYGIGYIAINPMGFFEESTYEEADFTVDTNIHYQYGRKGYANFIEYDVTDHFSLVVKEAYSTGFPLIQEETSYSYLIGEPDEGEWDWDGDLLQKNWTIITLDGRASFSPCSWCEIYGEAGVGFGMFDLILQTYSPSRVDESFRGTLMTGMFDVCGGITLLPENLLSFGNTSFQVSVYGGANVDLSGGMVWQLFNTFGTLLDTCMIEPYFGFGLKMNLDV